MRFLAINYDGIRCLPRTKISSDIRVWRFLLHEIISNLVAGWFVVFSAGLRNMYPAHNTRHFITKRKDDSGWVSNHAITPKYLIDFILGIPLIRPRTFLKCLCRWIATIQTLHSTHFFGGLQHVRRKKIMTRYSRRSRSDSGFAGNLGPVPNFF